MARERAKVAGGGVREAPVRPPGDLGEPLRPTLPDRPPARRTLPGRGVSLVCALAVAAAAGLLFGHRWHPGFYGDGPWLLEIWRTGGWCFGHYLFLPVARLFHLALGPLAAWEPHQSVMALSTLAAAGAVGLLFHRVAREMGLVVAVAAAALLAVSPALAFYAGAVEVHALAGVVATLALLGVSRPASSMARARWRLVLAYLALATAHLTCLVLGPALLLLHLGAEQRVGRRCDLSTALRRGAAMVAAAAGLLLVLLLLDEVFQPRSRVWRGGWNSYLHFMLVLYDGKAVHVGLGTYLAAEVLAPLGPLLLLAAAGVGPAWRRHRLTTLALVLWVVLLALVAWRVGAREHGAYLLPTLPALGLLAAAAVADLLRHRQPGRAVVLLLGLAAWALSIYAWMDQSGILVRGALDRGWPWGVTAADLALPGPATGAVLAGWMDWRAWLVLAGLAAFGLALRPVTGRRRRGFTGVLVAVLAACVLFQSLGVELFRLRWPGLSYQPWVDHCRAGRARLGPGDLLVGYAPNHPGDFTASYILDGRWVNLACFDDASGPEGERWRRRTSREVQETLDRGGRVVVSDDGVALLMAASTTTPRPQAKAWLRGLEAREGVVRWPCTIPVLKSLLHRNR